MEIRDYNAEMLKLYFRENNLTSEQIEELLEDNPFNTDFTNWEQQTLIKNGLFAKYLKKNNFIPKEPIQEITVHEDSSVGKYLNNFTLYSLCSANDNINKIKIQGRFVLVKGTYEGEEIFLKRLDSYHLGYLMGICTNDRDEYVKKVKEYKRFLKDMENSTMITDRTGSLYFTLIKSKNRS